MFFRQPFVGEFEITQDFGEKITSDFHTGIDYGLPLGTPVLAMSDGKVVFSGVDGAKNGGFGNYMVIEHQGPSAPVFIFYCHLSKRGYAAGQSVAIGQVIGLSGSSGNSTGPHLHIECRSIWKDAASIFDPKALPIVEVDDSVSAARACETLKQGAELGENLEICAEAVYFRDAEDISKRIGMLFSGAAVVNTGEVREFGGLRFHLCEIRKKVWIAEDDGREKLITTVQSEK